MRIAALLCHLFPYYALCLAAWCQQPFTREPAQDSYMYSYKDNHGKTQTVINTLQPQYMTAKGFTFIAKLIPASSLPPATTQLLNAIDQIAIDHGIDPWLARAIAHVESGFDPKARSPKGAHGIMQLMPKTASKFNVNTYNVVENITGGIKYLQYLTDYFEGDHVKTIAAYNAGERAVTKYKGVPPFRETQSYVPKVITLWQARSIYPNYPPLAFQ